MNVCSEHHKIMETLGEIKAIVEITRLDIKRLDERINGGVSAMSQHCQESDTYRKIIIKNEESLKSIRWVMGISITSLLIPISMILFKIYVG